MTTKDTHWGRLRAQLTFEAEGDGRFGTFEAGALVVVALGLSLMQFVGTEQVFLDLFGDWLRPEGIPLFDGDPNARLNAARMNPWYELLGLLHWVGACVLGYVLLPMAFLRYHGAKLSDYYLSPRGFANHLWIYVALLLPVLGAVVVVSYWPDFQRIYPFYRGAERSYGDLLLWELAYGVQFFALEFFFRGFMLQALRRWIGFGAVFVMIVPYCMLHFPKTAAESLAAILAGTVLGILAMKNRSIWGGVFIHWSVAIAMDVASMMQKGVMPTRWWPG